ncbi:phosphate ABC transporter substrate-binding protein PstS [Prolixibacter sp. SD074]|jgi:phosphate transport system substrate-binding protein|uniref:phosphate ABC transporter substrate-binding protein PstS n=1 Tax=Prolixibacter sp. SD074 TaxID=2652391 RepID=UPI00126C0BE4|nr:phosphate ABC transporter substrate-binding protein PstS [Prolixibacter sp. SD074]GET29682.1 phosphate-binding protein [Prolixibacter sp. SD074]
MKKILILLAVVTAFTACKSGSKKKGATEKSANSEISLSAAGATFPMPFYNMAFKKYTGETGVLMTYGGIGSGGGIRSLKDKVVDFGASDAFLTDGQATEMPAPIVHIPTCMGAVVVAFNLPNIESIKLTNDALAKIFLGQITKWNDPELKKLNPETKFPDMAISVVHRSDGSGTTFIFSDYLTKVSPEWAEKVGKGKSLKWPVGMGAKGNPGVAGTVSQTIGAVGYIGSEYAFAQKISYALLQNSSGNYIKPSLESVSAAAKGDIPDDTRVMLNNSSAPDAYPISGFTWIILYKDQNYDGRSKAQAEATVKFLDWLVSPEAQSLARQVNYAPLPAPAVEKAKAILRSVTYDGQPLLK